MATRTGVTRTPPTAVSTLIVSTLTIYPGGYSGYPGGVSVGARSGADTGGVYPSKRLAA